VARGEKKGTGKKGRRFHRLLAALICLVILLATIIWFLPSFLPLETIRQRAEEALSEAVERPTSIESIDFNLIRRTITFHNIIIKSPPGAERPTVIPIGKVTARVQLPPLLWKTLLLKLRLSELGPMMRDLPGKLVVNVPHFTQKPRPEHIYVNFDVDEFRNFQISDIVSGLGSASLDGGCNIWLDLTPKEPEGIRVRGIARLDNLSIRWKQIEETPLILSGRIGFAPGRLAIKRLDARFGRNRASISGGIRDFDTKKPKATLEINSSRLDPAEMIDTLRALAPVRPEENKGVSTASKINEAERKLAKEIARGLDLHLALKATQCPLPYGQADEIDCLITARNGLYRFERATGRVYGGRIDLSGSNLNLENDLPTYHFQMECEDLNANPLLEEKFIKPFFPALSFSGRFSCSVEADGVAVAEPERFRRGMKGKGWAYLTDGVLKGPVAPDYVAKIFPTLTLTEHKFDSMKADFLVEDGFYRSEMIFRSPLTSIYIKGETDPANNLQYILGVNFLGAFMETLTKEQRDIEATRIPLLKYSGRNQNGKMVETSVKFYPLSFLLTELVEKKIVGNVKKGLLGKDFIAESLKKVALLPAQSMQKLRKEFAATEKEGEKVEAAPEKKRGLLGKTLDIVASVPNMALRGIKGTLNLINPLRWISGKKKEQLEGAK